MVTSVYNIHVKEKICESFFRWGVAGGGKEAKESVMLFMYVNFKYPGNISRNMYAKYL